MGGWPPEAAWLGWDPGSLPIFRLAVYPLGAWGNHPLHWQKLEPDKPWFLGLVHFPKGQFHPLSLGQRTWGKGVFLISRGVCTVSTQLEVANRWAHAHSQMMPSSGHMLGPLSLGKVVGESLAHLAPGSISTEVVCTDFYICPNDNMQLTSQIGIRLCACPALCLLCVYLFCDATSVF